MSLDGGQLAVGAPGENAVDIYRDVGGSFLFVQRLVSSSQFGFDKFGQSVSLDGDTCLVGSPTADLAGNQSGAAYLYTVQELALTASTALAAVGETLTLQTHGGLPGSPCFLTYQLRSQLPPGIGSITYGSQTSPAVFDIEGQHVTQLPVVPGLVGMALTILTHGQFLPGTFGTSNPVSIVFE